TGIDENGLVGLRSAPRSVDDGDVSDGKLGRGLRRRERRHNEERREQEEENLSRLQRDAHLLGDRAFLASYHNERPLAGVLESGAWPKEISGSARQGDAERIK